MANKRIYNQPTRSPRFVMKTTLDSKTPLDDHPYAEEIMDDEVKKEELEEFFDDGSV